MAACRLQYIVVPGVLTAEEVAAANAVVDRHQHDRTGEDGDGRRDLRHMLGFEGAERAPFVNMLAHPRVAGYLNTIVGRGYRMGPSAPTPLRPLAVRAVS